MRWCVNEAVAGVTIAGLGALEHWSNGRDKPYSRNLGASAGVELLCVNM